MRRLFPSQMEGEQIYIVVREHWVRLFLKLCLWLMFAAALVLFKRYAPGFLFDGEVGQITLLFTQVYTMFLVLSLFLIWTMYYLNVQIITDRRIVDIDQVGLFSHTVVELHIENIEDVTSEINGPLELIFQYGNVSVQTAGAVERFQFHHVPNPGGVEKLLLDLYEKVAQRPLARKP